MTVHDVVAGGAEQRPAIDTIAAALSVREVASPEALLFQYVLNNGRPKDRNVPTLQRMFAATHDLGHVDWPRELATMVHGRDVLDFGCGATLYGVGFRALGARSYTGVDRALDPLSKRFRSRREKKTLNIGFSLADVSRVIPGVSYMQADGIAARAQFDVVLLQSVTHMLGDLDTILASLHRALRPGGEIWFLHENWTAWTGHQAEPRNMASFDPANPGHAELVDWGHVLLDPPADHRLRIGFNRVRLGDFRRLVDVYFEIDRWREVPDRSFVKARLTAERAKLLAGYSEAELFTKQVIGTGRRRTLV